MDIPALLQKLGFSEYEARAYVSLVRAGTLNGYEVAKDSGMPRANVYAVLERLVQRGAARRLKTRAGVRYAAIPPDRLVQRLEKEHLRTLTAAREALHALSGSEISTPVFNLQDMHELLEQARGLIDATHKTLLVAIQPSEAAALAQPLREARERGVHITTLCMQACATECGGCQGDIHRYCLTAGQSKRWLLLVADAGHMVAAEIQAHDVRAVATEQPLIVELTTAYIRQSLALATLAGDLGEDFHGLLSQPARQILDALHPEGGFLVHLKKMAGATV
ncbi:MAG: helix-turn-helix domain-containing protein [Gammaproteobacteria bacterium]